MAKIIGLRSGGSRAPGRLYATSFVVYANRYGYTHGYNSVRRFVPRSYDAQKFFRTNAREFGIAVERWAKMTPEQQAQWNDPIFAPDQSKMERYITDFTWLKRDPVIGTPVFWQGYLIVTQGPDHIKLHWEALKSDYTPHPRQTIIWVFKEQSGKCAPTPQELKHKRLFKPRLSSGKWRYYFPNDYDYTPGFFMSYRAIFTEGQNAKSDYSLAVCVATPSAPPGMPKPPCKGANI